MRRRTPRTTPLIRRPADLIAAAATLLRERAFDRAVALLEQAPGAVMEGAAELTLLGEGLLGLECDASAGAALGRALALDPGSISARLALGRLLLRRSRFAEAAAILGEADRLLPDTPDVLTPLGQAMLGLRRFDAAEVLLRRAAALRPDDPWPSLGLALLFFLKGDWRAAFPYYRRRRALPHAVPAPRPGDRVWEGEPLSGRSILLYGEQGRGDTIQFLRFAPILAANGAEVAIVCPPDLMPIAPAGPRLTPFCGPTRRRFDFVSSLIDVADVLGVTAETVPAAIPYLKVPERRGMPPAPAGTRLRVAICWAGSAAHSNDAARSVPFELFLPLLGCPGLELISVQVGPRAADIAAAGASQLVLDLAPRLVDFGDTAAILAETDLVISVDTSVAHLAGALGRPVWTLIPYHPDWRWGLGSAATPWYPTMRLFRQSEPGAWEPVFAGLRAALETLAAPLAPRPVPEILLAEAERLNNQALGELKAERLDAACERLGQGVRSVADVAKIWNNLGVALRKRRHFPAAEAAFLRAVAIEPSPGPVGNLANTLTDLGRMDEARRLQDRLLAACPPESSSIYNYGITLKNQGEGEAALRAFDRALELDPANCDARWDRSHELLRLGRWGEGWRDYEIRWSLPDAGTLGACAPMWSGQSLTGRTILVIPEQGFGDTVFALRFLPVLKRLGASVVVQAQPELLRLLARFPWIDHLVPKGCPPPVPVDYQTTGMSLPGHSLAAGCHDPAEGKPYLSPDPALATIAAAAIPPTPGLNIGIVWSGSLTFRGNAYRRADLADFLPLARDPRVRLFSLQKGPVAEDLYRLRAGTLVTSLDSLMTDFDMTAALLARLDGIVMTDSSVVHLAGALGRPVWAVLGERPYWLWGLGERTSWYDSVRLVRRARSESWEATIARAGQDAVETLLRAKARPG